MYYCVAPIFYTCVGGNQDFFSSMSTTPFMLFFSPHNQAPGLQRFSFAQRDLWSNRKGKKNKITPYFLVSSLGSFN